MYYIVFTTKYGVECIVDSEEAAEIKRAAIQSLAAYRELTVHVIPLDAALFVRDYMAGR